MKTKLVGMIVFMLISATTISVVGIVNEPNEILINEKGGLFRQLPSMPENPMPNFLGSDPGLGWQVYDDFSGLVGAICHIHW